MATIIRGTTPTIRYTFSSVDVSDIDVAKLIIKQNGVSLISKELSDATVGETYLDWKLSQEDTFKLSKDLMAMVGLDWLLEDGTRGIGNSVLCSVCDPNYNQVIE